MEISKKQEELLTSGLSRINLLEGSVRSGKTFISLVAWALFVASMPRDAEFLMVGKTITTLERNCLKLLQNLEPDFDYSRTGKRGTLYGRQIWLEGANDEAAQDKIRGMTLAGVYMDELSLLPKSFYSMALGRLSYPGAKLIATTNPDTPMNYVYTDIMQNEAIDKKVTKFLLQDNTFLDPYYVEQIQREYTGVFYQRFILGEWVKAEGLIYPMYDNTVPTIARQYTEYQVSMDYGIQNPTVMILWGCHNGKWYAVREYAHSGRTTNEQKTDEQYYAELEKLCEGVDVKQLIIDPSASSFIVLVRQRKKFKVRPADNAVIEGIQHTASALSNKAILFNDCCEHTIQEFGLYVWDDKAEKDTPIKENDHGMDAVRYFVQTNRLFKEKKPYVRRIA